MTHVGRALRSLAERGAACDAPGGREAVALPLCEPAGPPAEARLRSRRLTGVVANS